MADALSRQHYDRLKAGYVRKEIARNNLVVLNPFLNNYEFFTPGL